MQRWLNYDLEWSVSPNRYSDPNAENCGGNALTHQGKTLQ